MNKSVTEHLKRLAKLTIKGEKEYKGINVFYLLDESILDYI
ncbi:MAG: hypothetical protein ACOC1X_01495 [Promethearchaeota archaeon]